MQPVAQYESFIDSLSVHAAEIGKSGSGYVRVSSWALLGDDSGDMWENVDFLKYGDHVAPKKPTRVTQPQRVMNWIERAGLKKGWHAATEYCGYTSNIRLDMSGRGNDRFVAKLGVQLKKIIVTTPSPRGRRSAPTEYSMDVWRNPVTGCQEVSSRYRTLPIEWGL